MKLSKPKTKQRAWVGDTRPSECVEGEGRRIPEDDLAYFIYVDVDVQSQQDACCSFPSPSGFAIWCARTTCLVGRHHLHRDHKEEERALGSITLVRGGIPDCRFSRGDTSEVYARVIRTLPKEQWRSWRSGRYVLSTPIPSLKPPRYATAR